MSDFETEVWAEARSVRRSALSWGTTDVALVIGMLVAGLFFFVNCVDPNLGEALGLLGSVHRPGWYTFLILAGSVASGAGVIAFAWISAWLLSRESSHASRSTHQPSRSTVIRATMVVALCWSARLVAETLLVSLALGALMLVATLMPTGANRGQ